MIHICPSTAPTVSVYYGQPEKPVQVLRLAILFLKISFQTYKAIIKVIVFLHQFQNIKIQLYKQNLFEITKSLMKNKDYVICALKTVQVLGTLPY